MPDRTNTFYEVDSFHGFGSQLLVGQGDSPQTYRAVAGVISIGPGAITTGVIEKTHLRSRNTHKEKRPGLRDSGPFTIKLRWIPKDETQSGADDRGLLALSISREVVDWKILLSDGSPATEWPFQAFVSSFQPGEIGTESDVDATVELTPVADYSGDLP